MEYSEKCPNCGHSKNEGDLFCGNCGKPFEEKQTPPDEPQSVSGEEQQSEPIQPVFPAQGDSSYDSERKYVPWEDRENLGFFEALWLTWKESLFNPESFFSRLPYRGGIGSPLLYAVLVGWLGIGGYYMINFIFQSTIMMPFANEFGGMDQFGVGMLGFGIFFGIIMAPILIIIGLFIMAGIYHLIFMIFGWAERDFEATFRALAYAYGASVFMIVPFCGGMVGGIWQMVLSIFGFKHMQKTTGGKAALVYFIPMIFCCCIIMIIMMFMGAAFMEFFNNSNWNNY